jgi:hypothetical protein
MQAGPAEVRTLADAERAHIVATLRKTHGVVGGRDGAAARLGLPRTSLIARMHRLGLAKTSGAQPGAQNDSLPDEHSSDAWEPDHADSYLVSAAGAGYGGSHREYSYAR